MLLALLLVATTEAASYDPALTWRSLRTEHFVVTFHDGEEALAEQMADVAEVAWDKLVPEIENEPRERIELVLVDWTDSANGYAKLVPKNTIVIYVTAPEEDSTLALYEDWNSAIVTHELTHILHMSTVEGLPKLARLLMGTYISTHQVSPGWTIEGYATFEETRMSRAGRGRSATVDMVKRTAVLEDRFPPLGNMDGYQSLPPSGNLRYLFGQDFIQFVADTTGEEKWTEWVHRYGRSVPYLLPARRTFGKPFRQLHREWRAELERRYSEQAAAVSAEGLTPYDVISEEGQACGTPAWRPDGKKLAWSCSDPRRGSRILLAGPDGEDVEVVAEERFARNISWRADGKAFAYSTGHVSGLYSVHEDVFLYETGPKRSRSLTTDARARDPSFSPDGSRMVVVTNHRQQNQLAVLTVDQQLRPLTNGHASEQFGTPRYSPDGRLLAVSAWKDGLRDLWLYTASGEPWRRLTFDAAIDREPAWSADGRWLYFTSDRSGIPNVYAIEVATERLYRVTNVVTGAWGPAPSPDGETLAFQVYTTLGGQVAVTPLVPDAFKPLGALPSWPDEPRGALVGPPGVAELPPAEMIADEEPVAEPFAFSYPVTPYNPLRNLFPPRFWVPGVYLTSTGDGYGLYAVAATYGADTLQQLAYSAYGTWRSDANFFGGGGSFTLNRWRPIFAAGGSTQVTPYGDVYVLTSPPDGGGATIPAVESSLTRYWDHRVRGWVAMSYPISEYRSVSASYTGTSRDSLDELPEGAYLPSLPTRGFFSSIAAGWRYGKGTSYTLSISPEDARSLAVGAEYTPSWLGSWTYDETGTRVPFDQLQVTAEWREYVSNPWLANHVFATKLSGGASVGDRFNYGSFRLGGTFSESGITVVPSEWRMLRGYWPASDSGETYWLGSAEYRFPILYVDRGWGTFPFFLKNVSGAVFADAGNAFDDGEGAAMSGTLLGTGAELRVYSVVSYGMGLYLRLGYGFSALGDGIPLGDLDGLYASLGTSF